jgi:hypothetical protein
MLTPTPISPRFTPLMFSSMHIREPKANSQKYAGRERREACSSQVSSEQWKREFLKWSHIHPKEVIIFNSKTSKNNYERKNIEFIFKRSNDIENGQF